MHDDGQGGFRAGDLGHRHIVPFAGNILQDVDHFVAGLFTFFREEIFEIGDGQQVILFRALQFSKAVVQSIQVAAEIIREPECAGDLIVEAVYFDAVLSLDGGVVSRFHNGGNIRKEAEKGKLQATAKSKIKR